MNDRAVALLEQYDIEVLRTRKGRGAILCETPQGMLIFKEYAGNEARLALENQVLQQIAKQGNVKVDCLLATKEGARLTTTGSPVCRRTFTFSSSLVISFAF